MINAADIWECMGREVYLFVLLILSVGDFVFFYSRSYKVCFQQNQLLLRISSTYHLILGILLTKHLIYHSEYLTFEQTIDILK